MTIMYNIFSVGKSLGQETALVAIVQECPRLGVGQVALLRPAPTHAAVAVEGVKGPFLSDLVPAHEARRRPPHQGKPIPDVLQGLRRTKIVLLVLDLGPLACKSEELRFFLETLRTSFHSLLFPFDSFAVGLLGGVLITIGAGYAIGQANK